MLNFIDNNHSTDSSIGAKKSESHDGEWETDNSSEDKNILQYKNFDTDDDCSSATINSEKCKKNQVQKIVKTNPRA